MKKGILIIVVLIMLFVALGCTIISVLKKEKVSITMQEFKTIMEKKGFNIGDATSQYSSYGYIDNASIGMRDDGAYQIEFYTLNDDESAIYFYNTNKTIFENSKSGATSQTTSELSNYSKYTLKCNDEYKVVSRINNTVVYVNVEDAYEGEVKDILKEIGY